jgi:hypothetical protein
MSNTTIQYKDADPEKIFEKLEVLGEGYFHVTLHSPSKDHMDEFTNV